jgi:hypothetical protein
VIEVDEEDGKLIFRKNDLSDLPPAPELAATAG